MRGSISSWRVAELTPEQTLEHARGGLDANAVSKRFFDWQLEEAFEYAILIGESLGWRGWFAGGSPTLPAVCLGLERGRTWRRGLEQRAVRGFELLAATQSSAEVCRDFFAQLGYAVSAEADGADDAARSICQAWNIEALNGGLLLASRLGCRVALGFGHDADPLYIFSALSSQDPKAPEKA